MEIWKDVSLSLILKDKGSSQDCLPFCWFCSGSWDILKKVGLTEKKGEVLEVTLPGMGEMTYLEEGRVCLGDQG